MIGNEKEIQELSVVSEYGDLEEYMDLIDAYIKTKMQLEDYIIQTQRKMIENQNDRSVLETCKVMLSRYRKQIESVNRMIEKHNHKYLFYLDKYKNMYGEDDNYKKLDAIFNRNYYMMYENDFLVKHKEGNYIVNYFELKEKNEEHKITLKKIAQLEMKEAYMEEEKRINI